MVKAFDPGRLGPSGCGDDQLPHRLVSAEHCVEHEHGQSSHDQNRGQCSEGIEAHVLNIGERWPLVDTDLHGVAKPAI